MKARFLGSVAVFAFIATGLAAQPQEVQLPAKRERNARPAQRRAAVM